MKPLRLDEKLKEMVGNTYMYHAHNYKILSFELNGQLTIVTDKKWLKFQPGEAEKAIKEFLPVEADLDPGQLQVLPKANEMVNLKAVLLENITRLQTDKEFIQQAHAINASMTTLVNITKLEMSYMKFIKENR